MGAGKPRKRRALRAGSRHIPVEVARAVWMRDEGQCTFVDELGRRCSEQRFVTFEHRDPFARGGPPTVENLCLLCSPHNSEAARQVYGEEHIERKRMAADVFAKTLDALVRMGFSRKQAKGALKALRERGAEPELEPLIRQALALLVK